MALRQAARELTGRHSIRDRELTLRRIVEAAVETVPEADAGGITVTEHGEVVSRHTTSPTITKLAELQAELGEGPCMSALHEPPENGIILAQDLGGADGQRWPQFAPLAVEAGYHAMLSVQIAYQPGPKSAALNLYAVRAQVFDEDARTTAALFAVQAAMLLYGCEQAIHLQRAVDSRDTIGQAKGILMERFGVDDEGAFQMLVRSSQDTNLKLVEVARWLHDEACRRGRVEHGS
ncbi:GAF and ANTAR domain-containing protein [Actinomycetospora cinnamomea]|uniref:GAF and ANTAR domain-containing protein n=1 Tax=Actinomycetospora cinnamomea TaxID=663609 RepID=UPI001FAF98DE|nr:GAF and ANTAR domain-containing protein [Actinomycetospora cinnamomea]